MQPSEAAEAHAQGRAETEFMPSWVPSEGRDSVQPPE